MKQITALIILLATIVFNLYLNYPETKILADPNDNIFQYSLVARTDWVWQNYGCPFSLSCLPNLLDHNVTAWAEGYPLPFYYSHLPQIAIVSSYHLFIKPIFSLFALSLSAQAGFSLFAYYSWTKYLLLCFFPLPIFLSLRLVGFSPILSSLGALFASNFSTDGLYGIDPPSFLWRGYGLTSQLYAMFFLPLGIAYTWRTLTEISNSKFQISNSLLAIIFLTLTTAGHLGIGIIGLLSTVPFLFLDLNKTHIISRAKKLFTIYFLLFTILSYWIIPAVLYNNYHIISFWDPLWKFNSYGWYEAMRQFLAGELFDWQRLPVITLFVLLGFFTLLLEKDKRVFSLLFAFMFLLYFGRTTWGGLIDLVPGMKDFHLHRFIVGVHLTSLFLIPSGIKAVYLFAVTTSSFLCQKFKIFFSSSLQLVSLNYSHFSLLLFSRILFGIILSLLAYQTIAQTITYASFNNRWINEANIAYLYDEKNFNEMTSFLSQKVNARVYAGRPGNWGKKFRLGSTEMYMLLGVNGFDMSQFLPETWSMMSENDQNFDERVIEDYDLLNIRYIVADQNHDFPAKARLSKTSGPFNVFEVPTSGWFDVVTSPMFVVTDKTNFINLVHYWHRSYVRRWKMHPLISVEKNPVVPDGMKKIVKMVDEVSYIDLDKNLQPNLKPTHNNIFTDFPFVFPEATISGKISKEKVDKQTYSATIDVPAGCKSCMAMFKMSYHPNWKTKIDGQESEKYAVFPYYLATPVTSGTHLVEFSYQPNRLKTILLVTEIILGGFLAVKYLLSKKRV